MKKNAVLKYAQELLLYPMVQNLVDNEVCEFNKIKPELRPAYIYCYYNTYLILWEQIVCHSFKGDSLINFSISNNEGYDNLIPKIPELIKETEAYKQEKQNLSKTASYTTLQRENFFFPLISEIKSKLVYNYLSVLFMDKAFDGTDWETEDLTEHEEQLIKETAKQIMQEISKTAIQSKTVKDIKIPELWKKPIEELLTHHLIKPKYIPETKTLAGYTYGEKLIKESQIPDVLKNYGLKLKDFCDTGLFIKPRSGAPIKNSTDMYDNYLRKKKKRLKAKI